MREPIPKEKAPTAAGDQSKAERKAKTRGREGWKRKNRHEIKHRPTGLSAVDRRKPYPIGSSTDAGAP